MFCLTRPRNRLLTVAKKEISRQLGFLRFPSLEASREFLERNFPTIYLYGNSASHTDNRGIKVRIAYSREREDRNRVRAEGEWACKIVSRHSSHAWNL